MSVKLTDLTEATALAGTDLLYAVVGGNSRKFQASLLEPTPLLGTISTTSLASQSLTSLVLTPYRFLRLSMTGVSTDNASWFLSIDGVRVSATGAAATFFYGDMIIDLSAGTFTASLANAGTNSSAVATTYSGDCNITTASTTVTAATSAGVFDNGNIRVYGVR